MNLNFVAWTLIIVLLQKDHIEGANLSLPIALGGGIKPR